MYKQLFFSLLTFLFLSSEAQTWYDGPYRSTANPFYWKNRKPNNAYWQQDVHYKIRAKVDEKTDIIQGQEWLTYYNNSPDALPFVYFHLYQNAFQPGSYLDDLAKGNGVKNQYGRYEKMGLGTQVIMMQVNGVALKTELDNTILKVYLNTPLAPGDSVTFQIEFKTYFQDLTQVRRRMKMFSTFGQKHFDGVHWYPRISVYDKKFGWDTNQHLEKEFYGDFGSYDVELDMANNMVVEATGILRNESEVMPKWLRDSLDIKKFARKGWDTPPSIVTKYDSTVRKVWKYEAVNVHDFAFTADPAYRIGEVVWNGIRVISVCQEQHASRWQNAASYTADVIRVYSEDFGMYAYPKMVVADARDGMEYPMLTLDGGYDPDYRDLLAHEVGHNWFFGMIGSNETYRAALDEGFTQFLTCWAYERIDGKERKRGTPKSKYIRDNLKPDYVRNSEVYNGYLFDFNYRDEVTLNTHSSMYSSALRHGGGYSEVYMKTATMLYNLQYVMGDELFLKSMQHYFSQWKICHPYWEDFKESIIGYSKVDLNWFFDQWFDTPKFIDYGIDKVIRDADGSYLITFERNGTMQMPIDFDVYTDNDSVYHYHIPNTVFIKDTKATVLPKWFGWDKINQKYTAKITIPGKIRNVIIDPTNRLADFWMLDNSEMCPVTYAFDSRIYNVPDWKTYELFTRPDIWYNGYDGFKAGLHANGSYMGRFHKFDANVWFNSGILQQDFDTTVSINQFDEVSFRVNYSHPTDKLLKNSSVWLQAKLLDGLDGYLAGFDVKDKKKINRYYLQYKSMIRRDTTDINYLLVKEWNSNRLNNTLTFGVEHPYSYKNGNGNINLSLRSSTLMSDYDYSNINLTVINRNRLGKKLNFNTRFIAQLGTGSNPAPESSLFLAGANPEEMMDNKFTRSIGFVPAEWAEFGKDVNYFHHGGGLNLRGYAGYLAPQGTDDGDVRFTYRGSSGAAFNAELEFDQLFRWGIPKFIRKSKKLYSGILRIKNTFGIKTYLFGDIGAINYNQPGEDLKIADFRADAGVGATFTIKRFGVLQTVDPLVLRFDMPLFLNRIPFGETEHFKFRWIVGVNRAF